MQRDPKNRIFSFRVAAIVVCCCAVLTSASPALAWQFRDVTPKKETAAEKESGGEDTDDEQPASDKPIVDAKQGDAFTPTPPEAESVPAADTDGAMAAPPPESMAESDLQIARDDDEATTAVDTEAPPPLAETPNAYDVGKSLNEQIEVLDESDESVRTLRFNGVMIGESSAEDVIELWGQPFKIVRGETQDIIKYRTRPFRQIDVTVQDDVVVAILVHLDQPLDPAHCANELAMNHVVSVPVPDEFGKVLGLAFPERGVLFSFHPDDPDSLVSKIHLEQVNPEPFVLRAQYDFDRSFESDLADIDLALEMNPGYAKAHWVRAEILTTVGRYHDALDAATRAVVSAPDNIHFQLTKAKLLDINGEYDVATREIERILANGELTPALRALAELQLGNLIAEGPLPRFKEAMRHHLKAIDLAAPLANDRRFVPRRLAKQVLVDAHLAIARNISRGEYQRQRDVSPKWLSRGRALVEELVSRDQGDRVRRLSVYRCILATAADLRNPDDPSRVIEDLLEDGRHQVLVADDQLNASRIEWELGMAICEAVRLQRLRGAYEQALQLADDALVLLQQSAPKRQSTPAQRLLVGQLYFHIGSLHAVHNKDHDEAIQWYAKAEPMLQGEVPVSVKSDAKTFGESFISMGVSYWQEGQQNKAIELTEHGTDILQQAVVDGILTTDVLSIPYGNLASMHQQTGNESDAQAFAELAESIQTESDATDLR